VTGSSKQNFHQKLDRWLSQKEEQEAMIPLIREIRKEHPSLSARIMYDMLKPTTMGRDKFERFCFERGFRVNQPKNFRKTTDSSSTERFPNLIEGLELTRVNQVLVSDITYYEMNGRFYYLTFIMDLYTREIVGFHYSKSLRTKETSLPAMRMAVKRFGKEAFKGAIFHSDGGGQYYAKEFLKLTSDLGMVNSMAEEVYQNSHAERINGIIKNNYLAGYNPQSEAELKKELARAVFNYNTSKPHGSLKGRTPAECRFITLPIVMKIKQVAKTVEIENNSPSYFPTSTVHHHQHEYV